MDFSKIKLYYHTIRFLKPVQVSYRLIGWLKKKNSFNELNQKFDLSPIIWKGGLKNLSSLDKNNSFIFLNTFKKFDNGKIDWNYSSNGKLWTYNLNYFDFLNQYSIDVNQGIQLINQFIDYSPNHIDGVEPYPISLRSINWVKFLSKNKIINNKINAYLFKDCSFLFNNLEYHILGNHLLENAFSLFFSKVRDTLRRVLGLAKGESDPHTKPERKEQPETGSKYKKLSGSTFDMDSKKSGFPREVFCNELSHKRIQLRMKP